MSDLAKKFRRVLPLLKFATKVVNKIPTREDTWPQRVAKVLSLFDAANDVYGTGQSRMRELTERYGLVERESETFVRLFFATTLREHFAVKRTPLDDHQDLIEAVSESGERLFFRETHYGNTRVESDFHMSEGLNLARVIDRLWSEYPNGIYLSVASEAGGWRKETTICDVPPAPSDRLSKAARAKLEEVVAVHKLVAVDGVQRTYLCFGPAGTGKTSFAVLFARATGGRALKLDATSLPLINVKELGFLLDTLRPSVLVIDDLDRAPIGDVAARVLFTLERLKTHYPGMTVVLSVNDATKLDPAMLRCGRIDVPIQFTAPEREETEQMVRSLLAEHDVPAARRSPAAVARIIEQSVAEHLSHAYVDDLCRRLRHEELDDVLASVALLKRLADEATTASDTPPVGGVNHPKG